MEEIQENNRVQLEGENGILVSIYPSCSGSISDAVVQANPTKYNNAQVATEDMLTSDMISWTVGAQVGRKFSKQFALNKTAQKVAYNSTQQAAEPAEESSDSGSTPSSQGGSQGED